MFQRSRHKLPTHEFMKFVITFEESPEEPIETIAQKTLNTISHQSQNRRT